VKRAIVLGLSALFLLACEETPAPAPAASAKPVTATSAAAPPKLTITPVVNAEVTDEALPTIEDFEDEADKEITTANLEKELEALEKEIGAAP